jgi:Spy/CpxP family protein refolding chaperone
VQWDGDGSPDPNKENPMMRRIVPTVLALLSVSSLVPCQQGLPPGPPPPEGPGPQRLEMALDAIDLTAQQEVLLDPVLEARHAKADSARPAAEAARRALGDQIRSASFDDAAIRARAAAVAGFEADRAVADAALLRDVRAVLTSAQRVRFDRLMEPKVRSRRDL